MWQLLTAPEMIWSLFQYKGHLFRYIFALIKIKRLRCRFIYIMVISILARRHLYHYTDVIMGTMASQITSLTIVYATVFQAHRRKHQSFASLAFVRGIHRVTGHLCGEFPAQRPVTRSFDVFFDVPEKRLRKQSWGWWFETPSCPLLRQCNDKDAVLPG